MKLRVICFEFYHAFARILDSEINEYTEKNNRVIIDFLIELHKRVGLLSIGKQFIFDYLTFQFNYWSELDQVKFGFKFSINKVFSKVALTRFLEKKQSFNWYLAKEALRSKGLSESILFNTSTLVDHNLINEFEEREKLRFHNQDVGIVHCTEHTTLYNGDSELCRTCRFSTLCKKILKQQYKFIYRKRGYV